MSKICRQYAEEISLSTVRFHPMEFAAKMAADIRGNNVQEDIPGTHDFHIKSHSLWHARVRPKQFTGGKPVDFPKYSAF